MVLAAVLLLVAYGIGVQQARAVTVILGIMGVLALIQAVLRAREFIALTRGEHQRFLLTFLCEVLQAAPTSASK